MSLSVKAARMGARGMVARPGFAAGDPGLFGFLGKVAKGAVGGLTGLVTGGPGGAVAGALAGLGIGGGSAVTRSPLPTPSPVGMGIVKGAGAGLLGGAVASALGPIGPGQGPGSIRIGGTTITPGNVFPGGADLFGRAAGSAGACPSGFRPNKTSYFLKDGTFVPEGSRCVRNRRRNNLNPRALTRALGRVEGFKKATSRASRITVRKPKGCR